jgi:putative transposase
VKTILKENGIDPGPKRGKGTWDEFLRTHAHTLWQCDFVSKPMWTATGLVDLYFLVFLHLGTRRCWISPCTAHPVPSWVSQQALNFLMECEDETQPTRFVMRDRDVKYTEGFDEVFKASGIQVLKNTPQSPNLRAHVERFVQTLKVECLGHFVIVAERHLNYICREFRLHYNRERPHSAVGHLPPDCEGVPEARESARPNEIFCTSRLGGLLNSYSRWAA